MLILTYLLHINIKNMVAINYDLLSEVKKKLAYCKGRVKRKAKGRIKYDYLVPGGPYEEQWDWDAFFMAVALAAEIPTEAVYLKNWALNYLVNATDKGEVVGCVTCEGDDPRLKQMKPFLAQGVYLASKFLNDFEWIKPYWSKLVEIVLYREKNYWNTTYDLGTWYDHMESGADNNVSILDYPPHSIIATDINTFIYKEYIALSKIAEHIGFLDIQKTFAEKGDRIKRNINKFLWNNEEKMYCNLDTATNEHIKRVTYSSFIPLWATIAVEENGRNTIQKYMLNKEYLMSDFGIRTLAKNDPDYNNVNMIKPYSNWQGPVWPIANYIHMHSLLNYGFKEEAMTLAETISKLVLRDIEKTGGMHEDYDAETGAPLAAPDFMSWNILVINMIDEAYSGVDPFRI